MLKAPLLFSRGQESSRRSDQFRIARQHLGNSQCLLRHLVAVVRHKRVVNIPVDILGSERFVDKVFHKALDTQAAAGDTLWDISYRFGKPIDRLIALNPWVKRPDENLGGMEVSLC